MFILEFLRRKLSEYLWHSTRMLQCLVVVLTFAVGSLLEIRKLNKHCTYSIRYLYTLLECMGVTIIAEEVVHHPFLLNLLLQMFVFEPPGALFY